MFILSYKFAAGEEDLQGLVPLYSLSKLLVLVLLLVRFKALLTIVSQASVQSLSCVWAVTKKILTRR